MEYPKIIQIKVGGEIEADDFVDELRTKCRDRDINFSSIVMEADIVVMVMVENYEEFVVVDNFLAGLVQEYMGKVTVEVE